MLNKIITIFSILVGICAISFFIFLSRPFYIARYGIYISIIAFIIGIILLYKNLPPRISTKWIAVYYSLILMIGAIFAFIYSYQYWIHSDRYKNPYITGGNNYAISFDEEQIKAEINNFIDKKPPECIFNTVSDDNRLTLDNFKGKLIVLNFWATWCGPCKAELPALDSLYLKYKLRGLVVITLSEESRDTLIKYQNIHPSNLLIGYYNSDILPFMPYHALPLIPQTFIFDRNGIMKEFFHGKRKYEEFEKIILKYL